MNTPDVTPAGVIALVQQFVQTTLVLIAAIGFQMSEALSAAILGEATVITMVIFTADTLIRRQRAAHADKIATAKVIVATGTTPDQL